MPQIFRVPTPNQVVELAIFGIAFAAALLVRYLALRGLRRHAVDPRSLAAAIHRAVRYASVLWCLAFALFVSLEFAHLNANEAYWAHTLIGASVIISLTLVASAAIERLIASYAERQGMPFGMAGLSRTLIRVVVLMFGATAVMANFGLRITPLLTAFGVGGIAVALALQDTLANFIAGVHILVEQPLAVGDFIRLENGQEGVVADIGWRTTRLRTSMNNIIVIPNTKIASGVLVNYSLPECRTAIGIDILVAHAADADAIARMALEEAAQVEGVLPQPAPVCTCEPGVLPTHLQMKLTVYVATRLDLWRVQSAIRMRLLRRFHLEEVPLPHPEIARAQRV